MDTENRHNLLPAFIKKFRSKVNPQLCHLALVMEGQEILLEKAFLENPYEYDKENLCFIADEELIPLPGIRPELFKPTYSLKENADLFIKKLDALSILHCFTGLLEDEPPF